jgi:hypothetical protein
LINGRHVTGLIDTVLQHEGRRIVKFLVINRAIIMFVFSYLIALWMVRFIAKHVMTARDTSVCGDTEFEMRC